MAVSEEALPLIMPAESVSMILLVSKSELPPPLQDARTAATVTINNIFFIIFNFLAIFFLSPDKISGIV